MDKALGPAKDLTREHILVSDILVIDTVGSAYIYDVIAVHGDYPGTRWIDCKLRKSTDPLAEVSVKMTLDVSNPVLGWVVPAKIALHQIVPSLDHVNYYNLIAFEVCEYIVAWKPASDRTLDYATIENHLREIGLVDPSLSARQFRSLFEKVRKHRPDLIKSHSGKVQAIGNPRQAAHQAYNTEAVNRGILSQAAKPPRVINMFHITRAVYHLLQSGLLLDPKDIVIVDTPNE